MLWTDLGRCSLLSCLGIGASRETETETERQRQRDRETERQRDRHATPAYLRHSNPPPYLPPEVVLCVLHNLHLKDRGNHSIRNHNINSFFETLRIWTFHAKKQLHPGSQYINGMVPSSDTLTHLDWGN